MAIQTLKATKACIFTVATSMDRLEHDCADNGIHIGQPDLLTN